MRYSLQAEVQLLRCSKVRLQEFIDSHDTIAHSVSDALVAVSGRHSLQLQSHEDTERKLKVPQINPGGLTLSIFVSVTTACTQRTGTAYHKHGVQAMWAHQGNLARVTRARQRQSFEHVHTLLWKILVELSPLS